MPGVAWVPDVVFSPGTRVGIKFGSACPTPQAVRPACNGWLDVGLSFPHGLLLMTKRLVVFGQGLHLQVMMILDSLCVRAKVVRYASTALLEAGALCWLAVCWLLDMLLSAGPAAAAAVRCLMLSRIGVARGPLPSGWQPLEGFAGQQPQPRQQSSTIQPAAGKQRRRQQPAAAQRQLDKQPQRRRAGCAASSATKALGACGASWRAQAINCSCRSQPPAAAAAAPAASSSG